MYDATPTTSYTFRSKLYIMVKKSKNHRTWQNIPSVLLKIQRQIFLFYTHNISHTVNMYKLIQRRNTTTVYRNVASNETQRRNGRKIRGSGEGRQLSARC